MAENASSRRDMRLLSVADVDNEIISAIEESDTNKQDLVWDPVYAALVKLQAIAELRGQGAQKPRELPDGWVRKGDAFVCADDLDGASPYPDLLTVAPFNSAAVCMTNENWAGETTDRIVAPDTVLAAYLEYKGYEVKEPEE